MNLPWTDKNEYAKFDFMKELLALFILCWAPLAAFEGFYVGGSMGGHLTEGAQAGSAHGTYDFGGSSVGVYPADLQQGLFDHGIAGILYAGYGACFDCFYMGAEGFLQFGDATLQNTQRNSDFAGLDTIHDLSASVKGKTTCCQGGVDFLPGIVIDPVTLIYGRVGVSVARTSLKIDSVHSGVESGLTPNNWNQSLKLSKGRTRAAFRAGAGLEQRLTPRISLRADYIYTDYGKLSLRGSLAGVTSGGTAAPVTVSNFDKLHIYDHAVLLGLNYRFSCMEPFCWDPCCAEDAYCGIYFGGAIGGGDLETTQHGGVVGQDPGFSNFYQSSNVLSQLYNNQFQGMLFLGYGQPCGRLYLGGEIFAQAATHTVMDAQGRALYEDAAFNIRYETSYDTSARSSTWQYGFDFRPGALLTPFTLLYGRVGVSAAEIKADSHALLSGISYAPHLSFSLPDDVSAKQWKAAFRLGLGIEHLLTSKLYLRADYIFTNYGFISFDSTATGVDSNGNAISLSNTLTSHLRNNAIVLGLSYHL